ncbi:MAG: N-acetylmuramoyl-L-alanine amidase [Helicobacter sp.]|nr:N-acetylmuramoyl-L-alanine amidase [Helicobacter sp.]
MNSFAIRIFCALWLLALGIAAPLPQIESVELDEENVILHFNKTATKGIVHFFQLKSNDLKRDIYDFDAVLLDGIISEKLENGVQLKVAQNTPQKTRLVLSHKTMLETSISFKDTSAYITIVQPKANKTTKPKEESPKAKPSAAKGRVVVIDPGHGGRDCGAMGVAKVCEKVVVLSVANELEKELKKRGYTVYMTRSKDVFIPLKRRTEFANSKNADVFISLHANATLQPRQKELSGIETYFLSPARSERAKSVAAIENKEDIEELSTLSRETVLGILNAQRLYASHRLALDVQFGVLGTLKKPYNPVDGGVREGPFWVLAGALMPSILLEIGYITHPKEGKAIVQPNYHKLLARGIANGIDGYFVKNFY